MAEGIKAASNVLLEFRKILEPCFGPHCKDVLMKSDTGVIYLSSSGDFIMNHLILKHPIAKLIKDTVSTFKGSAGDFSKTFIIVLSHFSIQFIGKYINQKTCRTIEAVSSTLSDTALSLFHVRNHIVEKFTKCEIAKILCYEEFIKHKQHVHSLLTTSLTGKMDHASKMKMIEIVCDVFHQPQFGYHMFDFFVRHFDDVCISMVGIPFSKSHVINGCFVAREPQPPEFKLTNAIFVLMSSSDNSLQDPNHHTLLLRNDSSEVFEKSLQHKMYTLLTKLFVKHSVSVIFTEDALPNRFSSSLQQLGIVIVPFVLEEDIKRLSHLYNIPIFSGLFDLHNLTEHQLGAASFIESTVLGRTKGCIIGPVTMSQPSISSKDVLNIQILLCTPSQGLQMQYQHILHNLFKIVSKTFHEESKQFIVVPGGGSIERYLSGILREHEKHDHIDDTEKSICSMLANSLDAIRYLLHRNSGCKQKRCDNVVPIWSTPDIDQTSNALKKCQAFSWNSNEVCFEPFHVKCDLYVTLIEFAIQLVKIQYIIPVTRNSIIDGNTTESDGEE